MNVILSIAHENRMRMFKIGTMREKTFNPSSASHPYIRETAMIRSISLAKEKEAQNEARNLKQL